MNKARIILEDGSVFEGRSFGYRKSVSGEVVFNTAMTGYPESLTDPSYLGQILVMTYPLVGNYGVPERTTDSQGLSLYMESEKIHIKGLVVFDYSRLF
ncbi:MAG: carbamoyl-phosphate synthase (glutamine-hydrolyzing) small subunit, partial [Bacteroidales bacterium]|nr:carbamoyl-phosphate synthase (glutamine-hydrolyzing) small subunit [Bacteroidales bacterium]